MTDHWENIPLENLFLFVIGGDWGKDLDFSDTNFTEAYCIRGSEIREWNRDKGKTAVLRKVASSSLEKRNLREGDILVEISGGGPDQPVGRTILIDKEALAFEPGVPKVCTNFLRLVRLVETVDKAFINYFLTYFYITGEVVNYQGGSNNLRNLKFQEYAKIEVPLPSLPEQRQIVTKLNVLFSSFHRLTTRLENIPNFIKTFRQVILTQAITGKLTANWRKERNLSPWSYQLAQDCCEKVQSGGTPKGSQFDSSGIPFLKVYNIVNQQIDFDYKSQFVSQHIQTSQLKKSIAYPGDVLMNIVGPPLGKIAIIPETYREWNLNQAITLFRPKEYLSNKFLYYFFCEGTSVRSLMNETRGMVGQVNISLSQCRQFTIPIPSFEEQQEIVKQIEVLFASAACMELQYNFLKKKASDLPKAVLSKVFSERID